MLSLWQTNPHPVLRMRRLRLRLAAVAQIPEQGEAKAAAGEVVHEPPRAVDLGCPSNGSNTAASLRGEATTMVAGILVATRSTPTPATAVTPATPAQALAASQRNNSVEINPTKAINNLLARKNRIKNWQQR